MAKTGIIFTAGLVIAFALVSCEGHEKGNLPDDECSRLLARFTEAVARGDSAGVASCWSRKSLEREGFFASLHSRIGEILTLQKFKEFMDNRAFEISDIRRSNGYFVIDFEWVSKDTAVDDGPGARIPMKYYVVEENGRLVFINPIDLFTESWETFDSDLLTYHYSPSIAPGIDRDAVERMDSLCREISRLFSPYMLSPEKADVFVAGSVREVGDLLLQPPAGGYAMVARNLTISPTVLNPHEYVHLITMSEGDFINAAFGEGIAVALGGTYWSTPDFSLAVARHLLDHPWYVPLDELLLSDDETFLANANVTYHEAGAFTRFFLDRYGLSELIRIYRLVKSGSDPAGSLIEVVGGDLGQLETEWRTCLMKAELPVIRSSTPQDAEMLFAMTDAASDDNGDGRYIYPADRRFEPGWFDLTSFEVYADESNVFFRIGFSRLGKPVVDTAANHTYVPGVIVGMNRKGSSTGHLQHRFAGLEFGKDGYDIRLDIGSSVIIYDSFERAIFASPDIRDRISNWPDNTIEFAIPISFIGRPSPEWKYFAGTVLLNDYSLGFMRSFPVQVAPGSSQYRFGGAGGPYNPPFVDLLLPDSVDQRALLGGRKDRFGRRMPMPMIGR